MEKETLSLPDIVDILGPRPYPFKKSVMEYLEELREREKVMEEKTNTDKKDETKFEDEESELSADEDSTKDAKSEDNNKK